MHNTSKTYQELNKENALLRQRIQEMESSEAERKQVEKALRESVIKFRMLYKSMQDAFVSTDMNGHIIEYNEPYLNMLGYSPEEISTLTYNDITTEKWHEMESAIIETQVLTRGYSNIYEKEYRRKDGTVFPVELRTTLLRDDQGAPAIMWAIVRDITKRAKAERDLKERIKELNCLYSIADFIEKMTTIEDLFQNVVNRMPHGWYYPEQACARIAFKDQEFKTDNFQETKWKLSVELIIKRKPIGVLELCYLNEMPGLDEGPFLKEERLLINAIAERLGKVIERKRTEEELGIAFVKRQELEFIVNHSPAVVWLWKAAEGWPVEYVSDNIALYGYTPDDFTSGRISFASIVHPDDLLRVGAEVEQNTQEGKDEFTQEYRIFTKTGEVRWVDDRTWVRRRPDGSVTHYQGILNDITDRKQAEEEREKLISELQQALSEVKTLSGLLPICASCKKIRDDKGYWNQIESYIANHSEAEFSHSICPDCLKALYPEVYEKTQTDDKT